MEDLNQKMTSLAQTAALTGETVDDTDDDEELVPVETEFRELYDASEGLREKMLRLAKTKQEEGNASEANILRVIAGDVLPLLSDLIATTGGAITELEESAGPSAPVEGLDEDDATQIYTTILSNTAFLRNLRSSAGDPQLVDGLNKLLALNDASLQLIRDTFGDEIHEAAQSVLAEAAAS